MCSYVSFFFPFLSICAQHTHARYSNKGNTNITTKTAFTIATEKKQEREWTKPNKHRDKLHKAGLIYLMFCILESSFIADGGFVDANAFHHIYITVKSVFNRFIFAGTFYSWVDFRSLSKWAGEHKRAKWLFIDINYSNKIKIIYLHSETLNAIWL